MRQVNHTIVDSDAPSVVAAIRRGCSAIIKIPGVVGAVVSGMLMINCQSSTNAGGTDFPNTRTVTGTIVSDNGQPASFTEVALLPEDHIPGISNVASVKNSTITDSNGCFIVHVADSLRYTLNALNVQTRKRLCIRNITPFTTESDTFHVSQAMLHVPGQLTVKLPDTLIGIDGFVYFPGTNISVSTHDAIGGVLSIDSAPVGLLPPLRFFSSSKSDKQITIAEKVEVQSGKKQVLFPQYGNPLLQLVINTSASGAAVNDTIVQFPFPVRLHTYGISIRSMQRNGVGITVIRDEGAPLHCETEQWDIDNDEALLWILVDSIYGNNATQTLRFYYTDKQPTAGIQPTFVFDTACGFSGVYHFTGNYNDATQRMLNCLVSSEFPGAAGILGKAEQFSDSSYMYVNTLFDKPSSLTLSAWVFHEDSPFDPGEVISLGDAVVLRLNDPWNSRGCQGTYYSDPLAVDSAQYEYLASERYIVGNGWHYLAYTIDNSARKHSLYIDGELSVANPMKNSIHYDGLGATSVIGNHGNGKTGWGFKGRIDEVRIEHAARSADWIRLCYLTQRSDIVTIITRE